MAEPVLVLDVASPSWALIVADQRAYDALMGWLLEEGLDPNEIHRIEVFDVASPFIVSALWAFVHRVGRELKAEPLGILPPLLVREAISSGPGDLF